MNTKWRLIPVSDKLTIVVSLAGFIDKIRTKLLADGIEFEPVNGTISVDGDAFELVARIPNHVETNKICVSVLAAISSDPE